MVYHINQISGLSWYDYVCIVAEFNRACGVIAEDVDLKSRGYSDEYVAMLEKSKKPIRLDSCGIRFTKSPSGYSYPSLHKVLIAHEYMEKGVMPFVPNGSLEQPAQMMEIISLIQRLKLEQQKRQYKG